MSDPETAAFNRGYLIACCNIMNLHGETVVARDVLAQLGLTAAEVDAMDLSEYDAEALADIRKDPHGDPISS